MQLSLMSEQSLPFDEKLYGFGNQASASGWLSDSAAQSCELHVPSSEGFHRFAQIGTQSVLPTGMRALIADDQPDVVEALRLLLKQEGYQIETANSPAAVLNSLSTGEFDLLMMDLNYARDTTSGQEGLDLLRSVRKLDSGLPVVVMTAWGSVPLAVEAMRGGAQDFVEKPWDNSQLLSTVRRQINNTTAEREELREVVATQRALLPKGIPQIPGCSFSAAWTPAGKVGGDYLDLVPLDERRLGICVGDASGKGFPAALMMSNLQAAVRALAPDSSSTDSLTNRLNRILCANTAPNKFVTLFYGVLEERRLTYTNAGHNAPMLVRADGEHLRLECGGALLGVIPDWVYQQGEVLLATGDRLVLFSDGITEAENSNGAQFGEERLLNILHANRTLDATALRKKIISAVADFSGGALQDDATLLVLAID
jgi:sigma-B regulation protein RsbU (phosphoserine phosphatase)